MNSLIGRSYPVGCGTLLAPNHNSSRCTEQSPCENCRRNKHANSLIDALKMQNQQHMGQPPHHNGMMQLSQELAETKAKLEATDRESQRLSEQLGSCDRERREWIKRAEKAEAELKRLHPAHQQCNSDVYANGTIVCVVDIPKESAEAICRGLTAATGCRVDWHYFGGRVVVKALAPEKQPGAGGDQ